MTSPRQRKKKAAILKLREKQKQQNQVVEVPVVKEPAVKPTPVAVQKPPEQKPVPVTKSKKEALRELSQMTQEFGGYEAEEKVVPAKSNVVDTPQQKPEEKKDEV